tara:strand:- start:530 stop:1054 length:525 start_codon:yes stop_codon:yes gene_type:complete
VGLSQRNQWMMFALSNLNVAINVTFNTSREEKRDGRKDGDQMKLNKKILQQIINEELELLRSETHTDAERSDEALGKIAKSALQKARRGVSGAQRAMDSSRLQQMEVNVAKVLDRINQVMSEMPGNQATGAVAMKVQQLWDLFKKQAPETADAESEPADPSNPAAQAQPTGATE